MAIPSEVNQAWLKRVETSWCNTNLLRNTTLTPDTLTSNVEGGDIVHALVKTSDIVNPEVGGSIPPLATLSEGFQEIETLFYFIHLYS